MPTGKVSRFVLRQDLSKMRNELMAIQKLQFSNKLLAESALLSFLRSCEDPEIESVELRPRPESLNSINGFVSYKNGERLFFKSHVEEKERITEYYNAQVLETAGYPMLAARELRRRPGKQIALYEIVSYPTMFDLLKEEEDKEIHSLSENSAPDLLLKLQSELDNKVFGIYVSTLENISKEQQASAPIQQLFGHRLSENGRLGLFYRGKSILLKNGEELKFDDLSRMKWRVNGVSYKDNLEQIIEGARRLLSPEAGPSVIGHGDAHNGNVFVDEENSGLYLFDPAFAGRHDPLLDLAKPLFHNVFARWMYFPEEVCREFDLEFSISGNEIFVEHNFFPSCIRLEHLQSRLDKLLFPLLDTLERHGTLRSDWQDYLRCALFCCAFLTVNLFAEEQHAGTLAERYSLKIKMLALALSVSMASALSGSGESRLSRLLFDSFSRRVKNA